MQCSGCARAHGFVVESIEKKLVYGVESYILRGKDEQGRTEVFNVPCAGFPQCEKLRRRSPGTAIKRIFDGEWRLTDIKIVKLARKIDNRRARKKQMRQVQERRRWAPYFGKAGTPA